MEDQNHPFRRSTDQRVIIHAHFSDHPPTEAELCGAGNPPRVQSALNPNGSVRLPDGEVVPATCLSTFIGDQFVRSGAALDPEKVIFLY